jgi:DUF971 family protein
MARDPATMRAVSGEIEVATITVDREKHVTVEFADGRVCTFDLVELRLACPCAACRTARERGETPWPRPASPLPLAVTNAELIGAWGLQLTWNDGHATGIYPWDALRRWCEHGGSVVGPWTSRLDPS